MVGGKKKVLLVTPNYNGTKSWMQCAIITARNLVEAGFDVFVLTSNTEKQLECEVKDGVKVHRVSGFLLPDPINMSVPNVFVFWKKLKEIKVDVVIVNKTWFLTSLIASIFCIIYDKEYYVQLDTMVGKIWFSQSKLMNAAMWVYARTVNRFILNGAKKCIIYHSGLVPVMKEWKLKYEIISQGVDYEKFANARPCQDVLNFKKGRTCFLFVGRLDEIKRWREYIDVCKKIKDSCFVFVTGAKHPEIQEKLKKELPDNFLLLGYRKDVANIMRACDVFVLPSKCEGNPDVLMEAQSAGLACISSNIPNSGVQDLIKNRFSGLLFNDWKELKQQMEQLRDYKGCRSFLAFNAQENVKLDDNEMVKKKLIKLFS